MAQHPDAIVKEKRKRTASGAWNDASIHRTERAAIRGRAAPRGVPIHVIRGADAPKIFAVIGKTIAQGKAE